MGASTARLVLPALVIATLALATPGLADTEPTLDEDPRQKAPSWETLAVWQADQLQLAEQATQEAGSPTDVARDALDQRASLLGDRLPANLSTPLDVQRSHLDRAETLLHQPAEDRANLGTLTQTLARDGGPVEKQAHRVQSHHEVLTETDEGLATALAMLEAPTEEPSAEPQALASAIEALAPGTQLTPDDRQALADLPASLRASLTELATRLANGQDLVPTSTPTTETRADRMQEARGALLAAVADLERELATHEDPWTTIEACPAFALDLAGEDSVYEQDCALIVDRGGEDRYANNAGGAHVPAPGPASACEAREEGLPAAAVLDVDGHDTYGTPEAPQSCGANGGAARGIGVLVDVSGDDTYVAASGGVNGGVSAAGLGTLIDSAGNDTYNASSRGANGGVFTEQPSAAARGTLIDLEGHDSYEADSQGVNGGAHASFEPVHTPEIETPNPVIYTTDIPSTNHPVVPHGSAQAQLVDQGGDDVYRAQRGGVNGGGAYGGLGLLVDAGGSDRYEAEGVAANGGGAFRGAGALADGAGDDAYEGEKRGVNGGAYGRVSLDEARPAGWGLLVDASGNDTYDARSRGVNGGGMILGVGTLVDGTGEDAYRARQRGVNGGGALGSGFLADLAGSDVYEARGRGANGGGLTGVGTLIDAAGNDAYQAGGTATNGGAARGAGMLLDRAGEDRYQAGKYGTNGGGDAAGVGVLVDGGGHDSYEAMTRATNGGGSTGAGFLFDRSGNDTYNAGRYGTNGGANFAGHGLLVDQVGDDRYEATNTGVNGGAMGAGVGLLYDETGDDAYRVPVHDLRTIYPSGGVNGGGPYLVRIPALGGLIDRGGFDEYADYMWDDTVYQRTWVAKGIAGIQCDSDGDIYVPNTPDPNPCPSNEGVVNGLGVVCVDPSDSVRCWGPAVSGTGNARGQAAVAGTGHAVGTVAASGTEFASGEVAASGTGTAYGDAAGVSGTGNAHGFVAVSGTGEAKGSVADASGCELGRQAETGVACRDLDPATLLFKDS